MNNEKPLSVANKADVHVAGAKDDGPFS